MLAADIHFEPEGHRYTVAGERWPSVTEVLDPLLELDGIPRAVLKAAAEFGTHVHMATDLFDKGILDEPALDPHLAPYLAGWKLFLRDTGMIVDASEVRVGHEKLRYAGTLDKVTHWKKRGKIRTAIVDIKSGIVPRTAGPQLSAYAEAHPFKAEDRYVLQLRGDASYRLILMNNPADWSLFLSALNIWRWRNAAAPNTVANFWAQVEKTDTCWLWKGTTDGRYGRFGFSGRKVKAHRFSWELANGPLPPEAHVLHKCDVTLCVRPDHLFDGTHTDNMRDMFSKGRRRILRGEQQAASKLTADSIALIRSKYSRGARQVDLAQQFNVNQTTISKIVRREAWRHIGG